MLSMTLRELIRLDNEANSTDNDELIERSSDVYHQMVDELEHKSSYEYGYDLESVFSDIDIDDEGITINIEYDGGGRYDVEQLDVDDFRSRYVTYSGTKKVRFELSDHGDDPLSELVQIVIRDVDHSIESKIYS